MRGYVSLSLKFICACCVVIAENYMHALWVAFAGNYIQAVCLVIAENHMHAMCHYR